MFQGNAAGEFLAPNSTLESVPAAPHNSLYAIQHSIKYVRKIRIIMIVTTSNNNHNNDKNSSSSSSSSSLSLPLSLQVLFGLNGCTLALPYLAILYIINDRVHIPVELLSAYGALSFVPWSFKPLYASIDSTVWKSRGRHELLTTLLVLSCLLTLSMALLPPDGVLLCFLVVFVQNIATSFAEFLLGLTLVDEVILRTTQTTTTTSMTEPPSNAAPQECTNGTMVVSSTTATTPMLPIYYYNDDDDDDDGLLNLNDTTSPKISATTTTTTTNEHILLTIGPMEIQSDSLLPTSKHDVEPIIETSSNSKNMNTSSSSSTQDSLFENLSGIYQGQAATARNIGSLLASLFLLPILFFRSFNNGNDQKISFNFCILLLSLTSIMPLIGAAIVWKHKVGSPCYYHYLPPSETQEEAQGFFINASTNNNANDEEGVVVEEEPPFLLLSKSEKATIATLQLLVIWMALKSVISIASLWISLFIILLLLFLYFSILSTWTSIVSTSNYTSSNKKPRALLQRNVALYLILVQIMPSASYQWYSYTYYLFGSEPMVLPILSLVESMATTLGSNVYAQYVAPKVTTRGSFIQWTGVATLLSALTSLLYLIITVQDPIHPENFVWTNFLLALPIGAINSFCSEIRFLPSVALATSSIQFPTTTIPSATPYDDAPNSSSSYSSASSSPASSFNKTTIRNTTKNGNAGLQYGSYISCIDFGDQLGAWITVPIVSALGITRGDWSNMTELIIICSACSLLSVTFLMLLPHPTPK